MTTEEFDNWMDRLNVDRREAAHLLCRTVFAVHSWYRSSQANPIPANVEKLCRYIEADRNGWISWPTTSKA